jgi:hypothetical protein
MASQEELVQARTDAKAAIVAFDRRWKGRAYDEEGRMEWERLSSAYLEADMAVVEGARSREMLLRLAQNGRNRSTRCRQTPSAWISRTTCASAPATLSAQSTASTTTEC